MRFLQAFLVLLLVCLWAGEALAQGKICTVVIQGVAVAKGDVGFTTVNKIASAKVSCSGPGGSLTISGSPSLAPFAQSFTGVTYTASVASGALLSLSNAQVTFKDSSFQGIHVGADSLVKVLGGSLTLLRTTFAGNVAGASAVLADGAAVSVQSSAFSNNSAQYSGGALTVLDADLTVTDSKFVSNKAQVYGGAVSLNSSSGAVSPSVTIAGTQFQGNTAGCLGGAVYTSGIDALVVDGSAFKSNKATEDLNAANGGGACGALHLGVTGGSALAADTFGTSSITNTQFTDNATPGTAAVNLYSASGSTKITSCKFTGNTGSDTAALSLQSVPSLSLGNTAFVQNTGGNLGAVVLFAVDGVDITNSSFTENSQTGGTTSSGSGGGAVYAQGCCASGCAVVHSHFVANQAVGGGGAIFFVGPDGELNITKSVFSENLAPSSGALGGAVQISYPMGPFVFLSQENTFTSNGDDGYVGSGGAIALVGTLDDTIRDCTFEGNNVAQSGGAIIWQGNVASSGTAGTRSNVQNCSFAGNSAGQGGGAILLSPSDVATITNCTFQQNMALTGGGAISMDFQVGVSGLPAGAPAGSASALVQGSLFADNSGQVAGGGLLLSDFQSAVVQDVVFHNNSITDGNGGGMYSQSGYGITLQRVEFTDNAAIGDGAGVLAYGGGIYIVSLVGTAQQYAVATFKATSFSRNTATDYGGGLAMVSSDNLVLSDVNMTGNAASRSDGGAVYAINLNEVSMNATIFDGNKAAGDGGAIAAVHNLYVNMSHTTFAQNSAGQGGGALSAASTSMATAISATVFKSNTAVEYGGAFKSLSDCSTSIRSTNFSGNSGGGGGAVYVGQYANPAADGSGNSCSAAYTPLLDQVLITNNTAHVTAAASGLLDSSFVPLGSGGGLLVQTAYGRFGVASTTMTGNTADLDGGAVALSQLTAAVTLSSLHLMSNTAGGDGGAVAIYSSSGASLALDSSTLSGNQAAGSGGAVYSDSGVTLRESRSTFTGNTAAGSPLQPGNGGAVACSNCTVAASTGSLYAGNAAASGAGGAIWCLGCSNFTTNQTNITSNTAGTGGGIYLGGTSTSFSRVVSSNLLSNRAGAGGQGGGGIASEDGLLWLAGSNFTGNTAHGGGGAVLLLPTCGMQASNCTYVALDASVFDSNAAGTIGGVMFSNSRTIPALLQCGAQPQASLGASPQSWQPLRSQTLQVPPDCAASLVNNTAGNYGALFGSGPSYLLPDQTQLNLKIDGTIQNLTLTMVDGAGQQVIGINNNNDFLVSATLVNDSGVTASGAFLSGQIITSSFNGSAYFHQLQVRGPPRVAPYILSFGAEDPSTNFVMNATVNVTIRSCSVGEVVVSGNVSGTGIDECVPCPFNQFSFDALIPQCTSCPAGANCTGGAGLVPQPGYWHSAANSTEVHLCARKQACGSGTNDTYGRNRTAALQACQATWYAELDQPEIVRDSPQFQANLSRLPCQLWGVDTVDAEAYAQHQCAPGYTGPLCGACQYNEPGAATQTRYGFYTAFKCTKCLSHGAVIFLGILGFLILFTFVMCTTWSNLLTNLDRYVHNEAQFSDLIKPLVLYLQYNLVASKLAFSWPDWIYNIAGVVQLFFGSGEGGLFSMDCLFTPGTIPFSIQRSIITLLIPVVDIALMIIFWLAWWYLIKPLLARKHKKPRLDRMLSLAKEKGINPEIPIELQDAPTHTVGGGSFDQQGMQKQELAVLFEALEGARIADASSNSKDAADAADGSEKEAAEHLPDRGNTNAMERANGAPKGGVRIPVGRTARKQPTEKPSFGRFVSWRRSHSSASDASTASPDASTNGGDNGGGASGGVGGVPKASSIKHQRTQRRLRFSESAKEPEAPHTHAKLQAIKTAIHKKKESREDRTKSVQNAMALEMQILQEFETFPQYMQRVMIVSVLVVSFFVYPSLCQAILNTFACYPLDHLPLDAPDYLYPLNSLTRWGHGYWQQDMRQECYQGAHLTAVLAIGVPGVCFVCLGIPLLGFLIMFRNRHHLQDASIAAKYGFLYHQYREQFWFWNSVEQLRLLILVVIVVFGRIWTPFVQLHAFIFVLLLSVAISLWLKPLQFAADLELISLTGFALIMFLSLYFVDNEYSLNPPSTGLVDTLAVIIVVLDIVILSGMTLIIVTRGRPQLRRYWDIYKQKQALVLQAPGIRQVRTVAATGVSGAGATFKRVASNITWRSSSFGSTGPSTHDSEGQHSVGGSRAAAAPTLEPLPEGSSSWAMSGSLDAGAVNQAAMLNANARARSGSLSSGGGSLQPQP